MLAYMKTLIDDVLTQNTTSTNYPNINECFPATLQIKNAAITEEVGGQAVVESPIDILQEMLLYLNSATSTTYNVTAATYDGATGDMDLTIGSGLAVNTKIVLKTGSLTFTCDKDNNASKTQFQEQLTQHTLLRLQLQAQQVQQLE